MPERFQKCYYSQWRNWVKTWAGAFSRFSDIYNDMDWEKISMAAILHLWKLILNCVWNINETCALIRKFLWSLPLPESMVQLLHFSLSVFYEDHNKECLLTKYEQFSKCCFTKIFGQCSKYLLIHRIKGILSGLRQLLATESPLKMMKNVHFTTKALFVLKIFKFLSGLFGHVRKWLDKKHKVNFRFYDVITWFTNNYNTDIAHYLKK